MCMKKGVIVLALLLLAGLMGCLEQKTIETVVTYYEPYPLAFYNAFYELGVPCITFEIKNPMDAPVTVRLISEYQGYSNPAVTTVIVMPGEIVMINQSIPLIKEKIEGVRTKTKFSLRYRIEYEEDGEWKVREEQTIMIDVYPMNTMVWALRDDEGNLEPMDEFIAVFVTPQDPSIQYLLAATTEYAIDDFGPYSDYGLYRSLPGYQYEGDAEEEWAVYVALQIKAIYNALLDVGMSYVSTPIAFGKDVVQRVKLPKETLETLSGSCIDGAILFASAIEALGMHPYIVLLPDHAFVAWEVKPGSNVIDALETTMVGNASFEEAWEYGNQMLEQHWDALQDDDPWNGVIVDIKALREIGIIPID